MISSAKSENIFDAAIKRLVKLWQSLATPIKKTEGYAERHEKEREEYQQKVADIPITRRIYIDESGTSRFYTRNRAWGRRGKKIFGLVPGRRFARVNVVAGYCDGSILGEYCYTGSTTAATFEYWFCCFLLPETLKGDVIIMDNARFHNKKRLREYARVYHVTIIFLPPYSPDYNPIEHIWANMKRFLRNTKLVFKSVQSAIYWYFALEAS
jgi:transposase